MKIISRLRSSLLALSGGSSGASGQSNQALFKISLGFDPIASPTYPAS
ncbi:hypothetical protein IPH70_01195 [Candidatus Roizmanbacteria bacterium]|nr:MAG: hypothetical protein IPH70_01195 [Candidatus Roizmanbacteria bacterium]